MSKFADFLDKHLSMRMAALSQQRHLIAVRDGVISSLPFIIIGSLFLIIAVPPLPAEWAITMWAKAHAAQILIPFRVTMFIMTLYITFGIGYNLAKGYKLDPLAGGQIAIVALLLSIAPNILKLGNSIMAPLVGIDDGTFIGYMIPIGEASGATEYYLPISNLGGHGLFMGMIVAIVSVEIMRLCKEHNLTIKMPPQVPPSVSRSFEALIPILFVVIIMVVLTLVFGLDLHKLVEHAVAPIVKAGDSLFGVLIPVFLITFFWSFGIHGVSVVGSLARPVWEVYLGNNATAIEQGLPAPHVAPETFFQWFVWIGGSGATVGLVLAMLFLSRSTYLKTMGRTCFIPSIFNINEPVIFGTPIVLNRFLIPPFIIVPLILAGLSYYATVLGFVRPTYAQVPWTLPAPIGAYLSTGGDWRAVVLVMINIVISFIMYLPFFKAYDKSLYLEETAEPQKA